MPNPHLGFLESLFKELSTHLTPDDAVVAVRQGVIILGKNASTPYAIEVATLDGAGQPKGGKRGYMALVESNPPHKVVLYETSAALPPITWVPV